VPGRDRHACGYPKGVWSLWARSAVSDGAARRSGATHNTSCVSMAPSGRTHAQRRASLSLLLPPLSCHRAVERSRTPTRTLTTSQKWREFQTRAGGGPAGRLRRRGAAWRAYARAVLHGAQAGARADEVGQPGPDAARVQALGARSTPNTNGRHRRDRRARSSGAIVGRERRCTRVHVCWRA